MAQGNKGFADLVRNAGATPAEAPSRLPPRTGFLAGRDNRLAELAAGNVVTRVHEYVDPARCRIWSGHNRDYAALDERVCADLIESFKAQGRQEVPAIVRRVAGDADHDYEVICGARRHWTVSWLRAHAYPEFRFLIEPRELTDEEAFRLADLENRQRKDLSDYERATDYARALDHYYGGSQQRMAERLEVSRSWLSRYLELSRLPEEVVRAFASPHVIGIKHAAILAPLLRVPPKRARMVETAGLLALEQGLCADKGAPEVKPATVVRRLVESAEGKREAAKPAMFEVRDDKGTLIASGERARGGALTLRIPPRTAQSRETVLKAVGQMLAHFAGK